MGSFIIKTIGSMCSMSIATGVLLWLETKDIHPDKWVANMIGQAESAFAVEAIWWVIIGIFGLIGLVVASPLYEFGKKAFNKIKNTLGGVGVVILVLVLLCIVPMVGLWTLNTLAELGGSSFYIEHGIFSYFVTLVAMAILKGS